MARHSQQVVSWRDAIARRYTALGVPSNQARTLAAEGVIALCQVDGGGVRYIPNPDTATRDLNKISI